MESWSKNCRGRRGCYVYTMSLRNETLDTGHLEIRKPQRQEERVTKLDSLVKPMHLRMHGTQGPWSLFLFCVLGLKKDRFKLTRSLAMSKDKVRSGVRICVLRRLKLNWIYFLFIELSGFSKDLSFSGKIVKDSDVSNGTRGGDHQKSFHNSKDFLWLQNHVKKRTV